MLGLWVLGCGPGALEARIVADPTTGVFPLEVTFDAGSSVVPSGGTFTWDFGDGETGDGETATHTYIGAGTFDATLTVVDPESGDQASTSVPLVVDEPACPTTEPPELWGIVGDPALDELSGIAASHREPGMFWVHEDNGENPLLFGLYDDGQEASHHDLADVDDFEDIATVIDPDSGDPLLFVGDIGDNDEDRAEIVVWVVDEPDPLVDSTVYGLKMRLVYPGPAYNAETLLVDPRTLDVYVVTKDPDGEARIFVKRAPHDATGPFVLEQVAQLSFAGGGLSGLTTTGGDISPDGTWIVIRTYLPTAFAWLRDGYLPLEAAFDRTPCAISIASEAQGEAVAFTTDGKGLVTVSEGSSEPLFHVAFRDR